MMECYAPKVRLVAIGRKSVVSMDLKLVVGERYAITKVPNVRSVPNMVAV